MANNDVIKTYIGFTMDFKALCEKYGVDGYYNISSDGKHSLTHTIVKEDSSVTSVEIEERTFRKLIPRIMGKYDCLIFAEHELHRWVSEEADAKRQFEKENEAYFAEHPEKVIDCDLDDLKNQCAESSGGAIDAQKDEATNE